MAKVTIPKALLDSAAAIEGIPTETAAELVASLEQPTKNALAQFAASDRKAEGEWVSEFPMLRQLGDKERDFLIRYIVEGTGGIVVDVDEKTGKVLASNAVPADVGGKPAIGGVKSGDAGQ